MKRLVVLVSLAAGLAACSQTPSVSGGLDVTGYWTGALTTNGKTLPINVTLSQQSSGTVTGTFTSPMVAGSANIAGNAFTGELTSTDNSGSVVMRGAFTKTSYRGSFTLTSNSSTATGSFNFSRQ